MAVVQTSILWFYQWLAAGQETSTAWDGIALVASEVCELGYSTGEALPPAYKAVPKHHPSRSNMLVWLSIALYRRSSVPGWTRCPQVVWCHLRGDWAIFCHVGSGRVGRVRWVREKSLEILRHGWEWTRASVRTDSELSHWAIMAGFQPLSLAIV